MVEIIRSKNGRIWEIVGHEHRKDLKTGKREILVFEVETQCCGCTIRDTEDYLIELKYCPICGDGNPELEKKLHSTHPF